MQNFLDTDIKYLPGVGPRRAEQLNKELNIKCYRDLLYYFPYRYVDRTKFYTVAELDPDLPYVQIRGVIKGYFTEGKGNNKRLIAEFSDETGVIRLIWFRGTRWIPETYPQEKST